MLERIPIIVVNIVGVYCVDLKLTKRLADSMQTYFHKNKQMRLTFTRVRLLTSEFVEMLFDTLYKRHGVKVDKLLILGTLQDEERLYLQQKGFKASKTKYETRKLEESRYGDSL